MRTILAMVALNVVAVAQTPVPLPPLLYFPAELKQYLALSDDQIAKINTLNSQLRASQSEKTARQFQVQREIAEETAKQSPDPMALGVRYFEIEALRRQMDSEQKNTATQIQAALTADQKTKLTALQQALLLYPTACGAIGQNLMGLPAVFPGNIIPVLRTDPISSTFLPTPIPFPACATSPLAIRNGDFSGLLP